MFNSQDCIILSYLEESPSTKTVVLRMSINETEAMEIVEQKKAGQFGSMLSRVKKEEIVVGLPEVYYECMLRVAGRYAANYYVKKVHTITVTSNVRDVVLGDTTFPINTKSKFGKIISGKHGKSKVDLELDEHVFIEEKDELTFDHHGMEAEFPFKIDSNTVESYPDSILEDGKTAVRDAGMTHDEAVQRLEQSLKGGMDDDAKNIQEEFVMDGITRVYVPIFEARLSGPDKREKIIRIDAVRKKIV